MPYIREGFDPSWEQDEGEMWTQDNVLPAFVLSACLLGACVLLVILGVVR